LGLKHHPKELSKANVAMRVNRMTESQSKSLFQQSWALLTKRDRKLLAAVTIVQVSLGLIDLVSVGLVGAIGSLAIRGAKSAGPGDNVSKLLEIFNLQNLSLQSQIFTLAITAASLMIGKTLFSVYFSRKTLFFVARRAAIISSQLLSKVLRQNLVSLRSRSSQQTLYSVTTGIDVLALGVIGTVTMLISDVTLTLLLAAGLFLVDPIVAFSSLGFFTTIAVSLHLVLVKRAQRISAEQTKLSIKNGQRILEVLGAYKEIYTKNRREFYAKSISEGRMQLAEYGAERSFMPNISKYIFELTTVLGAFLVSALQFAINDSSRAVAVLIIFLAASARISPALLRIQQGIITIKGNAAAAVPTLELLEELHFLRAQESETKIEKVKDRNLFKPSVSITELSFRYSDSDSFLMHGVNLQIEPGSVVAIVGPSGAGKSTLVDLLLGLIIPESGSILVGDEKPEIAIQKFEGLIAYVPQDSLIFEGSLRENVCLGYDPATITEEAIWDCIKIASLEEFVVNNKEGLDLVVGERGSKLSGGQRQRLGIARAIVSNPKLIILDEATSSLDSKTEKDVSESIQLLRGKSTVIMIAHRLSTVAQADMVVYVDKGQILAKGTFDQVRDQIRDFDIQAGLMGL
jgi:ABC-type multidrug transport system fused ATPase/permease subunit